MFILRRAEVNLSMLILATRKNYSCKVNNFYTFVRVILPCLCFIFSRRLYEPSSIATGQLACYVNNELSRFNGHHLAAKIRNIR